jgi:hypothetical protein
VRGSSKALPLQFSKLRAKDSILFSFLLISICISPSVLRVWATVPRHSSLCPGGTRDLPRGDIVCHDENISGVLNVAEHMWRLGHCSWGRYRSSTSQASLKEQVGPKFGLRLFHRGHGWCYLLPDPLAPGTTSPPISSLGSHVLRPRYHLKPVRLFPAKPKRLYRRLMIQEKKRC